MGGAERPRPRKGKNMTQLEVEKKLLAIANERGYTPWDIHRDAVGATIRFKNCTLFMMRSYMMIWTAEAHTPVKIMYYDDMSELDYKLIIRRIFIGECVANG